MVFYTLCVTLARSQQASCQQVTSLQICCCHDDLWRSQNAWKHSFDRECWKDPTAPPTPRSTIILFNHMQGTRWEIAEDCRESSQAVTAKSWGKKHVTLSQITSASLLNFFPQLGLLCRQDWSSEFLSLSLSSKLLKLVYYLSQQENIKLLERSSKGNKEYTETGSLGDTLLVSI